MIRTNAFILKWIPFREADRIVTVFTESAGKLTGIAKGSLKMKSKITGALEPMTHVQLRYVAPYGRDLVVITGCDPISSLFGQLDDLATAGAVSVLSELTYEFNSDHDPNEPFYRLLVACHHALKKGIDPVLVLRYFELFTVKFAGYLPSTSAIKSPRLQQIIGYLLRTHIEQARLAPGSGLHNLGTYLRRIIRHVLGKSPRSYFVYKKMLRA